MPHNVWDRMCWCDQELGVKAVSPHAKRLPPASSQNHVHRWVFSGQAAGTSRQL